MLYPSLFKSPEAEQKYLNAYNALLEEWGVEHEAMDVDTSFGTTHINVAGAADSPPLFLMHGSAVNSTSWFANVAALSQHFRIYAPDIISQTGLTVSTRRPKTVDECADWLIEVMENLGIEKASIVGHSYGGWLTMKLAINAPQRIDRMILISPAPALKALNLMLILRMIATIIIPIRSMFYGFFQWMTTAPEEEWHKIADQFMTGVKSYKPQAMQMAVMSVFTDEELTQIQTPALLLIGDKEVVYKAKIEEVIERAKRFIPHVETRIIKGASHLATVDRAEEINRRIIEFLKQ